MSLCCIDHINRSGPNFIKLNEKMRLPIRSVVSWTGGGRIKKTPPSINCKEMKNQNSSQRKRKKRPKERQN